MTRLTLMALAMLLAVAPGVTAVVAQAAPETTAPGANPNLAFVHLAPFGADPDTAVDIKIDGAQVAAGIAFGDSTAYIQSVSGTRLIEVFAAGSTALVMSKTVALLDGKDYTVAAIGGANNWDLELIVLEDDNTPPAAGRGKVRIGHLAPFAAGAANTRGDVRLQNGIVIVNDAEYGDIRDYTELPAGTYDLKITTPDGGTTLIDPPPITLKAGDILSAFAVGDGANQPLEVLLLEPAPVQPTYAISGRVTDAQSAGLAGVVVSDGAGRSATTDQVGNYALTGLPAGTYTLRASKGGWTFSPASRTVVVPPDATGQDFVGTAVVLDKRAYLPLIIR
jgi:hypothetical protein